MTTNTLDTTRLSEDQLDTIWQRMHFDVSWALTWAEDIIASHRTLAADLARAEAERDRYREALEWYADPNNIDEFPDDGERARAALNGADDDTD